MLSRIFSNKRLLSLDWDDRMLRMVSAMPNDGRLRGVRAVSEPIPAELDRMDPLVMGQFIRQCLSEHKLGGHRAVVDMPRDQAILNTLTLPDGDAMELPAAVHFQIVKELPFALDEAVVDFAVSGPSAQDGMVDVLVAAVRHDVLDYYTQVIAAARLQLERVGLRPYANLAAMSTVWPALREGRCLLIDVGPVLTEIDVVRDGKLMFARAASVPVPPGLTDRGVHDVTPGPVGELVLEIARSVEAYRVTDPGVKIDRIMVSGGTGIETLVAKAVDLRFDAETKLYEPTNGFRGDLSADQLRGLAAAVGLVIGHGQPTLQTFDFLHPKNPVDMRAIRMRKVRIVALTAAVVVVGAGLVVHDVLGKKETRLAWLNREIAAASKEVKSLEAFINQANEAQNWANGEVIWLDHLRTLTDLFPGDQDAYADRLSLNDGGRIDLPLHLAKASVANEFASRLSGRGYAVVPTAATDIGRGGKYPIDGGLRIAIPAEGLKSSAQEVAATPAAPAGPSPGGPAAVQATEAKASSGRSQNQPKAEQPGERT